MPGCPAVSLAVRKSSQMDKVFTITEHRLIRSLLAKKNDAEIAGLIDCSAEQIADYVSRLSGVGKRPEKKQPKPVKQKPLSVKKLQQISDKARKEKEQKRAARLAKQELARQKDVRKREERRCFKTIPFDPAGKILVRLNSKTQVWVKPGTDIAAIKEKFKM